MLLSSHFAIFLSAERQPNTNETLALGFILLVEVEPHGQTSGGNCLEYRNDTNEFRIKCIRLIRLSFFVLTASGILHRPMSSLSCLPVDAVTAISFISFLNPLTPLTSKTLVIFSPTLSAGSKSHTSTTKLSSFGFSLMGLWTIIVEIHSKYPIVGPSSGVYLQWEMLFPRWIQCGRFHWCVVAMRWRWRNEHGHKRIG